MFQALALAQDLPGTRREDVLYGALARAVTSDEDGTAPVETLVTVLREVQRTSPGADAVLEAEDHARALAALQAFVDADGTGVALLERVLHERGW